jgi:hypothetical protein
MGTSAIELRLGTNWAEDVRLSFKGHVLTVEYDYPHRGGSVERTKICFEWAVYFEWREDTCFREEDVVPPTEIRCQEESGLLAEIGSLWDEATIHLAEQLERAKERFRHYTVYFDHAGVVNVIAKTCRVE